MLKPNADKEAIVASLKVELVNILMQLDEVATVIFEDTDCDGGIYNFKDLVYDKESERTIVKLAMWSDNLPAEDGSKVKTPRSNYRLKSKCAKTEDPMSALLNAAKASEK